MQIMAQGYFFEVWSIMTNCDNYSSQPCLPSKLKEHIQNNEHEDITSIIIISDFSGFLYKLCKLCKN